MGRRSDINWYQIEVDFRLGMESIRHIARKHGVSDSNLRERAKKEGWTRADGELARVATREALAEATRRQAAEIGAEIGVQQALAEREAMEEAVLTGVEVLREHQRSARRGFEVANQLLRQLELACAHYHVTEKEIDAARISDPARAALIEKQLGLKGLIDTLDRWSGAHAKISQSERQAHSLDSEQKPNEVDELLLRIAAARAA